MSMCISTPHRLLNKQLTILLLSNTILPCNEPEEEEDKQINNFDCDKIEPTVTNEANSTDQFHSILAPIINDDIILNTNSSINPKRNFRRRKQRSSLTRTSLSKDETKYIITDSIEKIDNNNKNQEEKSEEINENLKNKVTSSNRFNGRKLRYRLYHPILSTSEEPISDNTLELVLPTETLTSTQPSSPTGTKSSFSTNSTILTSNLKRTGSPGTTKKTVRFADSIGHELAQVQYIHSSIDDDDDDDNSKECSLGKNNLYVPKSSNIEHKPWLFDIVLASNQISDKQIPRKFLCLYRQPNSENPDIYLHEIWKSQIKLEHADIRSKSSKNDEQYLYGTLWVTNASYWKNVTVQYTFNHWLNIYEYEAQHLYHSNDFRNIDQYEFSIDIPHDVDRIEFVLRYRVNGQEHWDNNEGKNYTLETESAYTPKTTISLPHDYDLNEMRFY